MIESPVVLSGINLPTTDPTLGTQKSYPSALQAGGGGLWGKGLVKWPAPPKPPLVLGYSLGSRPVE